MLVIKFLINVPMTTIVYLVNQLRKSGPIHVLKNIITNLDRNAFRPVIIKFMRDDKVRSITNEFAEMGVEIHEMNLTFWDLELRTSYVARKLDVLLEKIRPDFLHTHGYHPVIVASLLKCICPKIETLHCISTDYYISSKGYLVGNWMNRRYNKGLSAMDCCVAISNSVCDFYKEIFPSKHIQTIYNGIDNAQYCGEYDKVKLRTRLNIKQDSIIFVVVGTLSKIKDPITVIKAFELAANLVNDKKICLYFLGQGPLQKKCQSLTMSDSNIELKGYVFNVPEYLKAADFSICASHSEGFGLNFIESVMAGTPVISSKIGPFNEFTDLYQQLEPYQFQPGDVEELSKCIVKAVNNLHSMDIMSAQRDAIVRFSAMEMSKAYMNLYLKLCNHDH